MDLLDIVFKDQPLIKVIKEVLKEDKDAHFDIKVHKADLSGLCVKAAYQTIDCYIEKDELIIKRARDDFGTRRGTSVDSYLKEWLGKHPYLTIRLYFTEKFARNWAYTFEVDKDLIVKAVSDSKQ